MSATKIVATTSAQSDAPAAPTSIELASPMAWHDYAQEPAKAGEYGGKVVQVIRANVYDDAVAAVGEKDSYESADAFRKALTTATRSLKPRAVAMQLRGVNWDDAAGSLMVTFGIVEKVGDKTFVYRGQTRTVANDDFRVYIPRADDYTHGGDGLNKVRQLIRAKYLRAFGDNDSSKAAWKDLADGYPAARTGVTADQAKKYGCDEQRYDGSLAEAADKLIDDAKASKPASKGFVRTARVINTDVDALFGPLPITAPSDEDKANAAKAAADLGI